MNRRFVAHWTPAVLAATAVTVLYMLPQLTRGAGGYHDAVLMHFDEPSYVARLVRALQGAPSMAPWLYEHRLDPSVVPTFVETLLAAPFRMAARIGLPCPSAGAVVVGYRAFFSFTGVLTAAFAFGSVGLPRKLAVLAAFWSYADPGLWSYKPLAGLVFGANNLPFDRFTNPLVGMSVFFLAWGCVTRLVQDDRRFRVWAASAGVVGGLLFYISFYYWTFFVAMTAAALCVRPTRWRALGAVLALAAVESIPYWLYVTRLRAHPSYLDIMWRQGLLTHGHVWSQYSNKTLGLFAVGALTVWRIHSLGARLLVLSVLAGLACFCSPAVTGVFLQAHHWHYTLAPMIAAACLWSAAHALEPRIGSVRLAWIGAACVAVLSVGGLSTVFRWDRAVDANPEPGIGANDRPYGEAWRWLQTNASDGSVVLASETTMGYVPLRTGLYVWTKKHAATDAVSFEELWDRNRTVLALDADARRGMEQQECVAVDGFNSWPYGLPANLAQPLERAGRAPFDAHRRCAMAHELAVLSSGATLDDIAATGRRYRLDYVVRGPNERSWEPAERIWRMTRAFEANGVRVDRVEEWLQGDTRPSM